ncbi:MAG: hypothetical protein ACE5JZ_10365 [Kiloniellales bacterium]
MPGKPGPKPRPAIVRAVFLDRRTSRGSVEVAFGTSKKTDRLYKGELLIASPSGMQAAGLDLATKFDLARTVRLPWAREFFTVKPTKSHLVLGSLHPSDVIALKRTAESLSDT